MNSILSIIIPTKNRQKYCKEAINQILSLQLSDIEICIQDNSDTNELESFITDLNLDCVNYHYTKELLSFVDNFNEAVSLCNGEYACMIGDDDGILPNILEEVKRAKNKNLDAVIPTLDVVYFWPSKKPIVKQGENGLLMCSKSMFNPYIVDQKKALINLIENAVQKYTDYDLPRLYHGIVKVSVLHQIKARVGTYFGGLTPDIYMATALSFVCKKVERVYYPITISGICPNSGSNDSATGKHIGRFESAPHLKGHENYTWHPFIPKFYSVETIWAETLLQALRDFNAIELESRFPIAKFDSICINKFSCFKELIELHAQINNISKIELLRNRYFCKILNFYNKVKKVIQFSLNNDKRKPRKYYNVMDITEAGIIIFK